MVYKWKAGSHMPKGLDAQRIGEHLERLRAEEEGLTPERVVDDARHEDSPTHPYFQWDDAVAAERYRIVQAGHLLRVVVVEVEGADEKPTTTRAFVVVSEGEETVYTSTELAMRDDVLRAQVLARAKAELRAIARKYAELEELRDVFEAIDRVVQQPELATA